MLGQDPKTSLFVRCCGVPAVWAGERKLWEAEFAAIRKTWDDLGKPTLVLACPTCRLTFETYLPEIPTEMLYDRLAPTSAGNPGTYAVFDPCASRALPGTQESIRRLAETLGFTLAPLPDERAEALCCGYGGHSAVANPEYTRYVGASRAAESAAPYIAYCANCRDMLRAGGKKAIHILDAVLDLGDGQDMDARARARADREPPTVTERQENRRRLKRALTKGTGKPARP
jgi:Fe-S oxidoreductase